MIEGHTDSRPYGDGSGYSNWELSADRANAVRRLLVGGGLSDAQILAVRGLADRSLRVTTDPLAPQNRRVTIEVKLNVPAADSLPPKPDPTRFAPSPPRPQR